MLLIDHLPESSPPVGSARDRVVLTWEERAKTRQQLRSEGGREIAVKLPTGTRLPPETLLFVGDGFHIVVAAADEDVWVIRSADAPLLARVAYEIGNRHFPIDIRADSIAVRFDHTLAELWDRLAVRAESARRPFLSDQRPTHHH